MTYLLQICTTLLILSGATCSFASPGRIIDYRIDGEAYEGYMIVPNPKAPVILLVHDWDGLNEYEISRASMLAEEGYAVFCVDMYGKGVRPTETADKRKLTSALYHDRPRMRALLQGALQAARDRGLDMKNGVAMGYCFGGAVVLELARSGTPMKGFVSFHGGLDLPEGEDYSRTKGKIMIFHGTADSSVSMTAFAELAEELEEEGVPHEMTTYGGAPHAFTVFGSPRYRADADKSSWRNYLTFLRETLPQ